MVEYTYNYYGFVLQDFGYSEAWIIAAYNNLVNYSTLYYFGNIFPSLIIW